VIFVAADPIVCHDRRHRSILSLAACPQTRGRKRAKWRSAPNTIARYSLVGAQRKMVSIIAVSRKPL
jgi:hypothetical protein